MSVKIPVVALVGCPNVGKSTLFNRVLGERRAIVEDTPGVTRDRNYALVTRHTLPFYLVDTGGLEPNPSDEMSKQVRRQTMLAIEESDVVLALFDGGRGVQPGDEEIVNLLRRYQKPVLFVANKIDGAEQSVRAAEFYQLGVDEVLDCSALHNRAIRELVERVLEQIPNFGELHLAHKEEEARRAQREFEARERFLQLGSVRALNTDEDSDEDSDEEPGDWSESEEPVEEKDADESEFDFAPVLQPGEDSTQYERTHKLRPITEGGGARELDDWEIEFPAEDEEGIPEIPEEIGTIRVAIVGKPNVGKSTMLNAFVGEPRAITSSEAGTTRDSLNVTVERGGQEFCLVDTAGLRKQSKVLDQIEQYSVVRALSSLSECDVAVLVIDATVGPTEQDLKIAGLAHEQGRGLVIALNKWDAVEKDHKSVQEMKLRIREEFKFAPYAPLVFTSAITGRRCSNLLETVKMVARERLRRVPTNRLNRVLRSNLKRLSPPSYRGQAIKLYFASQVDVAPPRFALFFNYPKGVHFSYMRFIKNTIREQCGFDGCEIKLVAKKR